MIAHYSSFYCVEINQYRSAKAASHCGKKSFTVWKIIARCLLELPCASFVRLRVYIYTIKVYSWSWVKRLRRSHKAQRRGRDLAHCQGGISLFLFVCLSFFGGKTRVVYTQVHKCAQVQRIYLYRLLKMHWQ